MQNYREFHHFNGLNVFLVYGIAKNAKGNKKVDIISLKCEAGKLVSRQYKTCIND